MHAGLSPHAQQQRAQQMKCPQPRASPARALGELQQLLVGRALQARAGRVTRQHKGHAPVKPVPAAHVARAVPACAAAAPAHLHCGGQALQHPRIIGVPLQGKVIRMTLSAGGQTHSLQTLRCLHRQWPCLACNLGSHAARRGAVGRRPHPRSPAAGGGPAPGRPRSPRPPLHPGRNLVREAGMDAAPSQGGSGQPVAAQQRAGLPFTCHRRLSTTWAMGAPTRAAEHAQYSQRARAAAVQPQPPPDGAQPHALHLALPRLGRLRGEEQTCAELKACTAAC